MVKSARNANLPHKIINNFKDENIALSSKEDIFEIAFGNRFQRLQGQITWLRNL